jgi:aspartate ammonia-lyase
MIIGMNRRVAAQRRAGDLGAATQFNMNVNEVISNRPRPVVQTCKGNIS